MERLTNSNKEIPTLVDNAEYWLEVYFKLKDYEDLEELIGIPLEELAKIFRHHIPDGCQHPKKAIVLTDGDVDKWRKYKDLEEHGRLIKLPCKEAYTQSGDIVYLIYDDEVVECTHCGLSINPVDGKAYIALATDEDIFPYRRPVPEYDLDPTD